MSTKLNKMIREDIRNKVLIHRYQPEYTKIRLWTQEFARAVYDDVFNRKDQGRMHQIPDGWLPRDKTISVKFGNDYESLPFNGGFGYELRILKDDKEAEVEIPPVPYNRKGQCQKVYEALEPMALQWQKLDNAQQDLIKEFNAASKRLDGILQQATTLGALVKLWPELKPFTKSWESYDNDRKVPCLPTEQLNDMFKLPVEEKAA